MTANAPPSPPHPQVSAQPATMRDIRDLIAERIGPAYDPVLFLAGVSMAENWPKSLRLQAAKEVARYTRPLVTPEVGGGDRATVVIIDHTREAAARGDVAALKALNQNVIEHEDGDARPETSPATPAAAATAAGVVISVPAPPSSETT